MKPSVSTQPSITGERALLLGTVLVFSGMVFWAFAQKFYLAPLFDSPALPRLLQLHGLIMTGWVLLLFAQIVLAATGRLAWHRRLGKFGLFWAALVVLAGSIATVHASAREVRGHTDFANIQLAITGLELTQMLLFAGLVTTAAWLRRRSDYHKRLMLLTLVCMLPSVLSRVPITATNNAIMTGLDVFVIGCVVIDTILHRRLHPAFGWGGAIVLGALHGVYVAAFTPEWMGFAGRVVS